MENIKYIVVTENGHAFCVDLYSVAEFINETNSKNVYIGYYNPIPDIELNLITEKFEVSK